MTGTGKDDIQGTGGRIYDVAVVGAGPAGCLTAAAAARAGLSVLLLEKHKLPRDKVCGGLISARALALLPPGLEIPAGTGSAVTAIRVHSRGKSYDYQAGQMLGTVVRRAEFDQLLAGYARSCGAVLAEESPLLQLSLQQPGSSPLESLYRLECGGANPAAYTARCVVGADGARGSCAVLSGLRRGALLRPAGWGYKTVLPQTLTGEEAQIAQFYTLPLKGGLGWSFPGPGWINRGVGAPLKPSRLRRAYRRLFPNTAETVRAAAWPLPFTGPLRKPARGNLLLVGDAAGVVDPFSGEGIYNAFKSALLAVSAVKTAFTENCAAGPIYSRLFYSHFRSAWIPALTGAALLHAGCLLSPQSIPRAIAAIMLNRCWFNRDLSETMVREAHQQGVERWS
jgi:menaquinone-9 beta-reductase